MAFSNFSPICNYFMQMAAGAAEMDFQKGDNERKLKFENLRAQRNAVRKEQNLLRDTIMRAIGENATEEQYFKALEVGWLLLRLTYDCKICILVLI